jgi:hypothetical protein
VGTYGRTQDYGEGVLQTTNVADAAAAKAEVARKSTAVKSVSVRLRPRAPSRQTTIGARLALFLSNSEEKFLLGGERPSAVLCADGAIQSLMSPQTHFRMPLALANSKRCGARPSRDPMTRNHLHRSCTGDFDRFFYFIFNDLHVVGAPGEIRTPGLLVRSQALYPTELRAQRTHRQEDISAIDQQHRCH